MFMAFLLSHNSQIVSDLVDQLFNSSEKRLARALLLLANFDKNGMLETVIPKVSQDDLAARVGTTRARINFFMNKFRSLGLIEYDNDTMKVHPALMNVIVHD
jgi:CRP-like cAMP-binding protein